MATENLGKCVTLTAGQNLSAYMYRFVTVAADGEFDPTGTGLEADGVLQDAPAAQGRPGCVMVGPGITKIVCSGAVTAGSLLACGTAGRAVVASSGDVILGRALESTTGSGVNQVISMLFSKGGAAL